MVGKIAEYVRKTSRKRNRVKLIISENGSQRHHDVVKDKSARTICITVEGVSSIDALLEAAEKIMEREQVFPSSGDEVIVMIDAPVPKAKIAEAKEKHPDIQVVTRKPEPPCPVI